MKNALKVVRKFASRLYKKFASKLYKKNHRKTWLYNLHENSFTRHWLTIKEYERQQPGSWNLIYPESFQAWVAPRFCSDFYTQKLKKQFSDRLPEFGVLTLERGKLLGDKHGLILTEKDFLLPEFSRFGKEVGRMRIPEKKPDFDRINGTCLSLVGTYSANYFHFLIDSLTRLHLFFASGCTWSDVDWVCLPPPPSEHAKIILEKLAIPKSKILWSSQERGIAVDRLIVPSFPGSSGSCAGNYPPWIASIYRDCCETVASAPCRRLYVSRKGFNRNLIDEDRLLQVLSKYDFEVYDPGENLEQWKDFQMAEAIVAPHGAALSNIVFCKPGT